MRKRHIYTPRDDDTFTVFSSETLNSAWHNLTGTIAGMAFGAVSVFLVVGGIVIMNIMLAVVTERTREIGIRPEFDFRHAPTRLPDNGFNGRRRVRKMLIYANATSVREKCTACVRVSAMLWPNNNAPIVAKYKGNAVYQSDLNGVKESFAESGQVDIGKGRFFTDFESHHVRPW